MELPHRPEQNKLDLAASSRLLNEIFEEAQVDPNTVSLEALDSYSCYRRERFLFQRILIIGVMVLFLLMPVLFISPSVTITEDSEQDSAFPTYRVRVDSLIPITSVTATIGGQKVAVSELGSGSYLVKPSTNGSMKVQVTLLNHQWFSEKLVITSIDTTPPVLVSNHTDSDSVYLYVSDDAAGIAYRGISARDENDQPVSPSSYDEDAGLIVFPYPNDYYNVSIPDYAGNVLNLKLKHK